MLPRWTPFWLRSLVFFGILLSLSVAWFFALGSDLKFIRYQVGYVCSLWTVSCCVYYVIKLALVGLERWGASKLLDGATLRREAARRFFNPPNE